MARKVCESCQHSPVMVATTGDAAKSPVKCHIALNAIECDDISSMSTTPKGVMDPDGRSGRSFLEFITFVSSLSHDDRPMMIVIECVNKLHHVRKLKSSSEKGTALVAKALEERGYSGEWKMLQTKNFALPQSRQRVYGIFVKTMLFGSVGVDTARTLTNQIWSFVSKCQVSKVEHLATLLTKHCGILDDAPSLNTVQKRKKGRPPLAREDRSNVPKWVSEHLAFRKKNGLTSDEDLPPLARKVIQARSILQLSEREAELGALKLAVALKEPHNDKLLEAEPRVLVGNIGDSVRYCRFRRSVHPCLLPSKKYLYAFEDNTLAVNRTPRVPLALQGIQSEEINKFNLGGLSLSEAQDLAGNAFTLNIMCAVLTAIVLHFDFDKCQPVGL